MRGIEIQFAKSSVFRKGCEDLIDLVALMVPEKHHLKHISIDVGKKTVMVMIEKDEDAE